MDIETLTIGDYNITSAFEAKRMFPKTEVTNPETGDKETKSIMVKRVRRVVTLTHVRTGDVVQLISYLHRGVMKMKDSRTKKGVSTPSSMVYSELQRMLHIDAIAAEKMMAF